MVWSVSKTHVSLSPDITNCRSFFFSDMTTLADNSCWQLHFPDRQSISSKCDWIRTCRERHQRDRERVQWPPGYLRCEFWNSLDSRPCPRWRTFALPQSGKHRLGWHLFLSSRGREALETPEAGGNYNWWSETGRFYIWLFRCYCFNERTYCGTYNWFPRWHCLHVFSHLLHFPKQW